MLKCGGMLTEDVKQCRLSRVFQLLHEEAPCLRRWQGLVGRAEIVVVWARITATVLV